MPLNKAQFTNVARERMKYARDFWRNWRVGAIDDYAFISGHQWLEADEAILREEKRPPITFNYSEKMIDAAEKDSAQLEKWHSRFYEDEGVEPKSILVVNAFRTLPLDKRTEPVFPDQMLKYATRKEQCLISGVQLLCLVVSATTAAQKKDAATSLLGTIGIYAKFRATEWKQVIERRAQKRE